MQRAQRRPPDGDIVAKIHSVPASSCDLPMTRSYGLCDLEPGCRIQEWGEEGLDPASDKGMS